MAPETFPTGHPGAYINITNSDRVTRIRFSGRLDAAGTAAIWEDAIQAARKAQQNNITVDGSGLSYLDGTGTALFLVMRKTVEDAGKNFSLANLSEDHRQVVDLSWDADLSPRHYNPVHMQDLRKDVGKRWEGFCHHLHDMTAFVGESTVMLMMAIRNPRIVRWKDVLLSCITVGVDSMFIITLIGFLMGLIMSFQSAVSLQQFGGEIFVPNMLGLVMFREMGPLVTAILLAARSGSAFAAEIGTMKINEELDALTTMGLSPMRFLVIPKLLSTMLMVPFMTIFFNLASLVGGALVMLALGFPLVTFTSRVFAYLSFGDFFGGMFKAMVFAILVAGVGCLRGIQTKSGASAVGLSTTSAVVTGIIFIAVADGLFAVAFYFLGW